MVQRKDCIDELMKKHGVPREDVEEVLNSLYDYAKRHREAGGSLGDGLERAREAMLKNISDIAAFERLRIVKEARAKLSGRLAATGVGGALSRAAEAAADNLPLPEWAQAFLGSGRAARARAADMPEASRVPDWYRLADNRPASERDAELIAESNAAAATPELDSIDPEKSVSAAEAAAKDASELLVSMLPRLTAAEKAVFSEAFERIKADRDSTEQVVREGAACLAEAALQGAEAL